MYFVDKNINYIPISARQIIQTENSRSHNHSWETGTMKKHIKNSDRSCDVIIYNAKRCTNCGSVLIQEILSTTHYLKCPH